MSVYRFGPRERDGRKTRAAGYTLIELLIVIIVMGAIGSISAGWYSKYLRRIGPTRAADTVGYYVTLTRSFAIQRRQAVSLVADKTKKELVIRTATGSKLKTLLLGEDSDFELDSLSIGFPGDSVTFSLRGTCVQCGLSGTGGIRLGARGTSFLVTFNSVGVWKKEKVS